MDFNTTEASEDLGGLVRTITEGNTIVMKVQTTILTITTESLESIPKNENRQWK